MLGSLHHLDETCWGLYDRAWVRVFIIKYVFKNVLGVILPVVRGLATIALSTKVCRAMHRHSHGSEEQLLSVEDEVPLYESSSGDDMANSIEAWQSLFNATRGTHWSECSTLTAYVEPCQSCPRVRCSTGGSIKAIQLSNNNLVGTLPEGLLDAFGAVLTKFESAFNPQLSGVLSSLGNTSALSVLDVYQTSVSGTIPHDGLGHLTTLSIAKTHVSGTIPAELGVLTSFNGLLWADTTSISGTIPSELSALTSLSSLSVHTTYISGTLQSSARSLR